MAKVKRVTGTDIRAPGLRQVQQAIDIPKGAFGAETGQALSFSGRGLEFSGVSLGNALFRQQERQSIIDANEAFRDMPIKAQNILEESKRKPGNLIDFDRNVLSALEAEADKTLKGIDDERTRARFESKFNRLYKDIGVQAVRFKNREFVRQGQTSNVKAVDSIIRFEADKIEKNPEDAADIFISAEEQIREENRIAQEAGFIKDAKLKTDTDMEALSHTVANAMVLDRPADLINLLESGVLTSLKDEDADKFKQMAINSSKRVRENAEITAKMSYLAKNKDLYNKLIKGTLKVQEVQQFQNGLSERVEQGNPIAITENRALELIKRDLVSAQEPKPKPSEEEKAEAYLNFAVRYNKLLDEAVKKTNNNITSDILDFQVDLLEAVDAGLMTGAGARKWITSVIPGLINKIDTRTFGEDRHAKAFKIVLNELEKNEQTDKPVIKLEVLRNVVDIIEDTEELSEKEKSELGIKDARSEDIATAAARYALTVFAQKHFPELLSKEKEEFPDTVITAKRTLTDREILQLDNDKLEELIDKGEITEEEFNRIIKRAKELEQNRTKQNKTKQPGLTLTDREILQLM